MNRCSRISGMTLLPNGYGVNRRDVMYNDFVLLGPPDDPAGFQIDREPPFFLYGEKE